jgi:hypothetical protein
MNHKCILRFMDLSTFVGLSSVNRFYFDFFGIVDSVEMQLYVAIYN